MQSTSPYLTPTALNIAPETHAGLITLAHELASGKIAHALPRQLKDAFVGVYAEYSSLRFFNMDFVHCGSVGCILGWLQDRGQINKADLLIHPFNLHELFFPDTISAKFYQHITPLQASRAIINYLTTGAPRWAEVLGIVGAYA